MEIQTRDDDGGLNFFTSVEQAFDFAEKNPSVWKVSFNAEDGTRCRFVRARTGGLKNITCWVFDPIFTNDVALNVDNR